MILLSLQTLLCTLYKKSLFQRAIVALTLMMQISSFRQVLCFFIFGHLAPGIRLSTFGVQGELASRENVHWLKKKGDEVAKFLADFDIYVGFPG